MTNSCITLYHCKNIQIIWLFVRVNNAALCHVNKPFECMYTRFSFISYEEFLNGAALNIFVVMINSDNGVYMISYLLHGYSMEKNRQ